MTKKGSSHKQKGRQLGIREFFLAILMVVIVVATDRCVGGAGQPEVPTTEPEPAGAIQVLFTTPKYPDTLADHYGSIDARLTAAIDAAQKTVDVAAFELDLERVTAALVSAAERGVRVRLVTDSDYAEDYGPESLLALDIPVVFDERDPFMHDKFVVIDGVMVWTGSWNLTNNCTYRNNNNVIVIQSTKLAENYTVEFEEMFTKRQFGPTSPDDTPNPQVEVNGVLIENFFESEGNVRERIIELIGQAEKSVYFLAFAFTDDDIAKALIARHRAGVTVQGVVEDRNTDGTGANYLSLKRAGVDILKDGNPYMMHHKVIIIDEAIVVMGSYNFSSSAANNNDENVLIIHNADIAAQYLAEFQRVYQRAEEGQ